MSMDRNASTPPSSRRAAKASTRWAGLLALESGQQDAEIINSVFRAAHSIKGGAGTFGFDAIAGLTHVLETLLDERAPASGHWKAMPSTRCCPRWTCCVPCCARPNMARPPIRPPFPQ